MQKKQKYEIVDDGFSSDEQIKHEQILVETAKKQQILKNHKEEAKFKIPPPQQIKSKTYSLHPDIATGWTQRSQGPTPIPLLFEDKKVDLLVRKFTNKKLSPVQNMQLCYLGPRFQNTYYAWYDQKFSFPYSSFKAPKQMKFSNRSFCGQHEDAQKNLIFDSFFQSGNLDCVIKVDQFQYDLYLRVDSNTRGHLNWYNFKIKNIEKLMKYKINICNIQKSKTLYNRGMKPYIFSQRKFQNLKKGWQQGGDSVRFEQKLSKSLKLLNLEYCNFCKLSFQFYTDYEKDQIQIAYCVPYTYTQLMTFLGRLQKQLCDKDLFTMSNLCISLGGLDVPIVTIHSNQKQNMQKQKIIKNTTPLDPLDEEQEWQVPKKCVVISGRVHPGQSNGSHMMHGFIEYLCGNSKQAKKFRSDFIIKIVPMLNPDGVCLGNYRTGISGKDFNRQYKNPDRAIFPEIHAFKKLVSENKAIYGDNLTMFLDFHGHSTKKNVFMYGPQFPIIQKQYYQSRIFPKMISNMTKMFRYYSCSFKINWDKSTTARAIFLRNLNISLSYTVQASNGSFFDTQTLKDHAFNAKTWNKMGSTIAVALAKYGDMIITSEKNKFEKKKQRLKKLRKDKKITMGSKNKTNLIHQRPHQSHNQSLSKQLQPSRICISNTNAKALIDEIKQAEQRRSQQLNSDDQISEGDSDREGEKDDLTPLKLNFLYQLIKHKKQCMDDKIRKRKQSEDEQWSFSWGKNHQTIQQESHPPSIYHEIQFKNPEGDNSSLINKKIKNGRGCWFKQKANKLVNTQINLNLMPQPQGNNVAKIINFNFFGVAKQGSNFTTKPLQMKNSRQFQIYSRPWRKSPLSQDFSDHKSSRIPNRSSITTVDACVLDLSNNKNFRRNIISAKHRELTEKKLPAQKQNSYADKSRSVWRANQTMYSRLVNTKRC